MAYLVRSFHFQLPHQRPAVLLGNQCLLQRRQKSQYLISNNNYKNTNDDPSPRVSSASQSSFSRNEGTLRLGGLGISTNISNVLYRHRCVSPQRIYTHPLSNSTRSFARDIGGSGSGNDDNMSSGYGLSHAEDPKVRTHAVRIFEEDYEDYHYDHDGTEDHRSYHPTGGDNEEEGDVTDEWALSDFDDVDAPDTNYDDQLYDEDLSDDARRRAEVLAAQRKHEENAARWAKSSLPPVRTRNIDSRGRAYGRGGRKTSSARVWIEPGLGTVTVNGLTFVDCFPRDSDRDKILGPLVATRTVGRFDVTARVEGGGVSGRAGAMRHGLANALQNYDPVLYRPPMKKLGYLTRDPRKVERKKVGRVKARKAPQWVRR